MSWTAECTGDSKSYSWDIYDVVGRHEKLIASDLLESDAKRLIAAHNAAAKEREPMEKLMADHFAKLKQWLDKPCPQCEELTAQLAELEQWKQSAMSVMPDYQAIGKELGLPISTSVNEVLLPAIKQLRVQLAAAKEVLRYYAQDSGQGSIHEKARDFLKTL